MKSKLFLFIFILAIYNNFAFGFSIDTKNKNVFIRSFNNSNFYDSKKNIKKSFFFKKKDCFSFLKFKKKFFSKKEKIVIGNQHFIGFFENDRFKMFYIVKSKDTLYSIAKNSGHNYYELSRFNSIRKPYKIIIGQKIWIGDFLINNIKNSCSITTLNNNHTSCKFIFNKLLNSVDFFKKNMFLYNQSTKICFFSNIQSKIELKRNQFFFKNRSFIFSKNWCWPVNGKNIKYFYNPKLNNKEIEISGFKGQPIFAAAAGEVVFITDLFKKYGRLIIIRHDKNYLSIYAFNNSILVKQKDKVYAKQNIATMGLSKNNLACLYFEIRYKGKPINPLNILPKNNVKKEIF